jgi:ferredoxin
MADRTEVTVDENRCVGSGDCANVAPTAFEVDEDAGLARVLPGAADTDRGLLERAAHSCPTVAISVTDAP